MAPSPTLSRPIPTRLTTTLLGLFWTVAATVTVQAQSPAWRPLFNGTDLHDWVQRGGKAIYRIEDDQIVGQSVPNTPNSFLCTRDEFANFILEFEFLVDPRLNSGVQIRSQSLDSYRNGVVHGYQIEIDPSARAWSAGIYDESRRGWLADLRDNPDAREAFRQNDWNHVRVEAVGERIRTWINGVAAADLRDDLTPSGFIALQVHGVSTDEPMTVRWRRIRIQELDDRAGTTRDLLGPVTDTMGQAPPADAVVLLGPDGDLSEWKSVRAGVDEVPWRWQDGALRAAPASGSIETVREFTDFHLHIEFNVTAVPGGQHSQANGNSGVYILRRYEIQILNSYGQPLGPANECGAIYQVKAPDANASRPAGEWQSYDIVFRSPRWDAAGTKTENARVSVLHNGRLIHDNAAIPNKTGAGAAEAPTPGPILLQDHMSPVRFRNAWIRELSTLTAGASRLEALVTALTTYREGGPKAALWEMEGILGGDVARRPEGVEKALIGALQTRGCTVDGARLICGLLQIVGTAQAVPILGDLLAFADRRDAAREALTAIPVPEAGKALREAYAPDSPEEWRQALCLSYGARADAAAVGHLATELEVYTGITPPTALAALGQIGTPEAVGILQGVDRPLWQAERDQALLRCAENLLEIGATNGARTVFSRLASSPLPWIAAGATRGLVLTSPTAERPTLVVTMLRANVPAQRRMGAELAHGLTQPDELMVLVDALGSLDPEAQKMVLDALRPDAPLPLAVPRLLSLLDRAATDVRAEVVAALGRVGDADVVPALLHETEVGANAGEAVNALRNLAAPGVDAALLATLRDRNAEGQRITAATLLGERRTEGSLPVLMACALEGNADLSLACTESVAELAGPEDLDSLLELLGGLREPRSAQLVARTMVDLGAAHDHEDRVRETMTQELAALHPVPRTAVLGVLPRLAAPAVLDAVVSQLTGQTQEITTAAVRALADWPSLDALPQLLELAETTDDTVTHVLAIRACVRLVNAHPSLANEKREQVLKAALATARRDEERALLESALEALAIGNLERKSDREYRIVPDGARVGELVYTDREYTFKRVPDTLAGATLIMTAMNDKTSAGTDFLSFVVSKPVTVWVGFDERCTALPAWLRSWEACGEAIDSTDSACDLVLYRKQFGAGTVTLGGNSAPGIGAMYTVLVR
jgi:HEAT repeat protein